MRDYLFRGKTDNGKWVYGSLISAGKYCCILESEDKVHPMDYPYLDSGLGTIDGQATPVIPETVGQFTGRLDKNGKQIFEGDIVRGLMDWGPAGLWEEDAITISFDTAAGGYEWQYFDMLSIEIIGNIYDNPELVEN